MGGGLCSLRGITENFTKEVKFKLKTQEKKHLLGDGKEQSRKKEPSMHPALGERRFGALKDGQLWGMK